MLTIAPGVGIGLGLGLLDHALGHDLGHPQPGHHVLAQQLFQHVQVGIQRVGRLDQPMRVDQDIDPLKGIQRRRQQVGCRQLFRHPARKAADMGIAVGVIGHRRGQCGFVPVGEHDMGAAFNEVPRNGQADTAPCPRHDGGLALDGQAHQRRALRTGLRLALRPAPVASITLKRLSPRSSVTWAKCCARAVS